MVLLNFTSYSNELPHSLLLVIAIHRKFFSKDDWTTLGRTSLNDTGTRILPNLPILSNLIPINFLPLSCCLFLNLTSSSMVDILGFRDVNTILEGCSTGCYISGMDRIGWVVRGIEPLTDEIWFVMNLLLVKNLLCCYSICSPNSLCILFCKSQTMSDIRLCNFSWHRNKTIWGNFGNEWQNLLHWLQWHQELDWWNTK